MSAEDDLRTLQLHHQAAVEQLFKDGGAIVEDGRARHGAATFNEAVQDVAKRLGDDALLAARFT